MIPILPTIESLNPMNHMVSPDFLVTVYEHEDELLIVADGGLRLANGEAVKNYLIALMKDRAVNRLIFHVGGLRELDSAGLGVLVGVHMTARKHEVDFMLINPTPYQMKLFETTRLNSILKIEYGVEAEQIRNRLQKPEYEIETGV